MVLPYNKNKKHTTSRLLKSKKKFLYSTYLRQFWSNGENLFLIEDTLLRNVPFFVQSLINKKYARKLYIPYNEYNICTFLFKL